MRNVMPVALISASTLRLDQTWRRWRRRRCDLIGQSSHWSVLKTVKRLRNGIACASSPVSAGASLLIARHETVGIDDRCAALTLAHMAAKRERLAKGEPALSGKSVFDQCSPEHQNVDAAVCADRSRHFSA